MKTSAVKTLIPMPPETAWDLLVAPEFPPLFGALPENHAARWVGNYLLSQPRIPGGVSVNIARVSHRPHRLEVEARSGRTWISLFDAVPEGTIWTAWIEGDFSAPPPSQVSTVDADWLVYYEVQLQRWSEAISSMGWLIKGAIPDDLRWSLD